MSSTSSIPSYHPGAPIWHQIPASDVHRAKSFYSALFPSWDWREPSKEPTSLDERQTIHFTFGSSHYESAQVSGGIQSLRPGETIASDLYTSDKGLIAPIVYYFVEDLDGAIEGVGGLGGKVLCGKTAEGEHGQYAVLRDTEGNVFGVYGVKLRS